MNWKTILSIFFIGILTFSLGWFLCNAQFSDQTSKNVKTIDSLQKINYLNSKIIKKQLDSLIILSNIYEKNKDFKEKISGEFIVKGAEFAGFNFISSKIVSWTNEMDAAHPDTLKIRWLNNATFFTQDIQRHNENCPPRVWVYQVITFDGQHLILKEINTSWMINSRDSDNTEFYKAKTLEN